MNSTHADTHVLLRVRGVVQGVGFRPFVHRTATGLGLHGWVRNDAEGVLIRADGPAAAVNALQEALRHDPPAAARVDTVEELEPSFRDVSRMDDFSIIESTAAAGATTAGIPPDLALCADCRRELHDPRDRRFRYPFINCTQCGPRYSIIEALPYDRERTTMRCFRMCPACRAEYENPSSRRFHAEPNACPVCGPQVALANAAGRIVATDDAAILDAAWHLSAGRIVAVKGIGGYHLLCDATDSRAVSTLRQRKQRDEKPLAVMFRDLAHLRQHADVNATAARLLESPEAPIVLVPRRPDSSLVPDIAPGNPWIGALLPYAPLHVLLLAECERPVVATSANLSDEPLCTDNVESRCRLRDIADFFLDHDRPIARAVDDSVIRLAAHDAPIILRRARGLAPRALPLPARLPKAVLCLGAQLKNTIAIAQDDQVTCSPHLGDLDSQPTRVLQERTIRMLSELRRADIGLVAHDLHPDYASTLYAGAFDRPTLAVQHHLAHVLACLLENKVSADDVLGVAWDGTGYGPDGTVWGGEFIRIHHGRAERFARLRPFRLVGGDAAARDARRVAFALAEDSGLKDPRDAQLGLTASEALNFRTMLSTGLNVPVCTSMGRLFDGVAALLGLGRSNNFEGQLPLMLETAAASGRSREVNLTLPVVPSMSPGARWDLDWRVLVRALAEPTAHLDPGTASVAFHAALVDAIVETARRAEVGTVALTGGCFQNALLHSLAVAALEADGFRVLTHRLLSPNDNSISAGQALAALWQLSEVSLPT